MLPKFICTGCLSKISVFHEFYRDVHTAQRAFIEALVKSEPSHSEAVVVSPICVADVKVEAPSDDLNGSFALDDAVGQSQENASDTSMMEIDNAIDKVAIEVVKVESLQEFPGN